MSGVIGTDGLVLGVRLVLRSPQDGGRRTPILDGRFSYRANWTLPEAIGPAQQAGAPLLCLAPRRLNPGGTGFAAIVPLLIETWRDLRPDQHLGMYEGARRCGDAVVLAVEPAELPITTATEQRWRDWVEQQHTAN